MKITILVLSLVLVGCTGYVYKSDMLKGEEFCNNKDGVMMYKLHDTTLKVKVICNNGEEVHTSEYKLKGTKK